MTHPGLCVTIAADTTAGLRAARDRVDDADLVELRLDTVRDLDVAAALEGRRRPVIVTCRPVWEGGQFRGSEEERAAVLADALARGAEYVDVEFRAGFTHLLERHAGRVVLSSHDFDAVPADLEAQARAMHGTGAAVVKIAVKASRLTDCLPLLTLGTTFGRDRRQVVIGMGEPGLATRILPGRFHSAWTYAGTLRGIGQLTAETLLRQYRFRTIDDATAIFGLTGFPISHSVSPAMHNAACAATGLNGVYLPMPAQTADEFLAFAGALGVAGASVTIPHKVALFERADAVDETARAIGAINTLKRDGGRWLGMNSDLPGFLAPLEGRGMSLRDRRVAILGAGGAARAVALGAGARGADVTVHARDLEKARAVASLAQGRAAAFPPPPGAWDVLVNCTPIGMHPHAGASPIELSHEPRPPALDGRPTKLVYDLIYNPLDTRLLRDARALGYATIGGLEMLVAQAIAQFRWWTGLDPDAAPMHAAAMARLAEFNQS